MNVGSYSYSLTGVTEYYVIDNQLEASCILMQGPHEGVLELLGDSPFCCLRRGKPWA